MSRYRSPLLRYRIAHNLAHNAPRDGALQPDLVLERRDRLRAVLASVRELPERQRDALLLRELEGRSYEEIADALGVGGGAVRQLLNRARTTLRTAATAVTPVGLLLRLPAGGAGGAGGEALSARVAELTGAAGAGAVAAKVAATALPTPAPHPAPARRTWTPPAAPAEPGAGRSATGTAARARSRSRRTPG